MGFDQIDQRTQQVFYFVVTIDTNLDSMLDLKRVLRIGAIPIRVGLDVPQDVSVCCISIAPEGDSSEYNRWRFNCYSWFQQNIAQCFPNSLFLSQLLSLVV